MPREDVLGALAGGDEEQFSEALRSAAMFAEPDELDDVLTAAVGAATTPANWWAIAQAINISVQARGLIPGAADAILGAIPDGSIAAESRDDAYEVIEVVRSR